MEATILIQLTIGGEISFTARSHLGLSLRDAPDAVGDFVMATRIPSALPDQDALSLMSILVYAVYSATNTLRHARPTSVDPDGILFQGFFQAVEGHASGWNLLRRCQRGRLQ